MGTALPARDLVRPFVYDGRLAPLGFQQITNLNSVQSLNVPAGATMALIQAEAQNVRYRDDGTAPTANSGNLLNVSDQPYCYIGNLFRVKLIGVASGALANVSYYQ